MVLAACHKFGQGDRVRSLHEIRKSARVSDGVVDQRVKKDIFLCFLNVIVICIFWLNMKMCVVNQRIEEDNNLDIFEITTNIAKLAMELINKELLIFRHYQVPG